MDFFTVRRDERLLNPWLDFNASVFIPQPYQAPRIIVNGHNKPRFGKPNDIGTLFDGNGDTTTDYVMGIVAGAIIIFLVAAVWSFAIISLKISGQKRVGFLAGKFVRPSASSPKGGTEENGEGGGFKKVMDNDQEFSEDHVEEAVAVNRMYNAAVDPVAEKKFRTRVGAVRIMFVFSGIVVIVAGGLFYAKGVVSFNGSLSDVRDGIDQVQALCRKGINLTDSIFEAQEELNEGVEPPGETSNEQICAADEELSAQIREVYKELTVSVEELRAMLAGSLDDFGSDLNQLLVLTEDIDNSLESAYIFFAVLIAISAVLLALVIAMIVGVFFAWKDFSNCFTKCIQYALIWPLFVLILILSWVFAMLFLSASLAGADFCIDPDAQVQTFLNNHSEAFDSIMFGFIMYYVSGCTLLPPGEDDFKQMAISLENVLSYSHELFTLLAGLSVDSIAQICGLSTEDATTLKALTVFLHQTTHFLNRVFTGLRDFLRCENFNSIYTTFVHQAFCVEGVSGLAYIFIASLVVATFSMVMIMLRAALYPIKEATASESRGEEIIEVIKEKEQQNQPPDEAEVPALETSDASLFKCEDAVQAVEDEGRNMPAEETAEEIAVLTVKKSESPEIS